MPPAPDCSWAGRRSAQAPTDRAASRHIERAETAALLRIKLTACGCNRRVQVRQIADRDVHLLAVGRDAEQDAAEHWDPLTDLRAPDHLTLPIGVERPGLTRLLADQQ